MRIAITTAQVPFIKGGAELMTANLHKALETNGHHVEVVSMPFVFNNINGIMENMDCWANQDLDRYDIGSVDRVICLKFPTYYLNHHHKIVWLMHQHRSVYDLWDTPFGDSSSNLKACALREKIHDMDSRDLGAAAEIFTISKTVSKRLRLYNNIASEPIYQPSPLAEFLGPGDQNPYILCPSRLEGLKRQNLLIQAAAHCKSPCVILIAGTGSMGPSLQKMIDELDLGRKVRLLGYVADDELVSLYRNSLGVFFAPFDEDYGFVTLEAMQSAKPVITCNDSGGPLEFVVDGETGFVVEPDPAAVAEKIDSLYADRGRAREIGMNAFHAYSALGLSWNNIVQTLLRQN